MTKCLKKNGISKDNNYELVFIIKDAFQSKNVKEKEENNKEPNTKSIFIIHYHLESFEPTP